MAKVKDIYEALGEWAPVSLKMDFDNVGLLVGDGEAEVTRALFALDVTGDVIEEARRLGAELIVSHHPVIWDAMKAVTVSDLQQHRIIKLIKNDVSVISMHTNLDIAQGGVNDVLMELLGGTVAGILEPTGENFGCGRVGELSESVPLADFLGRVKAKLNCGGLRYHDAGIPVKRLAVMGGSGGDCVELAADMGCDTYVTADIKYDRFLAVKELGINLIDAGHFETENPVVTKLEEYVRERFPMLATSVSAVHCATARFF